LVGFTHASSVRPAVRSSAAASGTATQSPVPSNDIERPNCPVALRVAPVIVPVKLLPDESRTAPVVSSNP
jgi:hypothetical protein